MDSLLDKTRKINKLLQKSENVEFNGISSVLSNVIVSNVYIVGKNGQILGYSLLDEFECNIMMDNVVAVSEFPKRYVEWLLRINETTTNFRLKIVNFDFAYGDK